MKKQDVASGRKHHHHDQQPGVQAAFLQDVKALVEVLEEIGNTFLEHSQDLPAIDTRDIMDTQAVRKIETLGEEQYAKFVTERLEHKQFQGTSYHCSVATCQDQVQTEGTARSTKE